MIISTYRIENQRGLPAYLPLYGAKGSVIFDRIYRRKPGAEAAH